MATSAPVATSADSSPVPVVSTKTTKTTKKPTTTTVKKPRAPKKTGLEKHPLAPDYFAQVAEAREIFKNPPLFDFSDQLNLGPSLPDALVSSSASTSTSVSV
jgi:hypothetical protein